MEIKIKEIGYGIASRIGSIVYLNKDLVKYPELRNALIEHELGHSSGYSKKDLFDDLSIKELKGLKKKYYEFILTHPSSWTEYLPAYKYEGKWIISLTSFLIWGFAILVFWIVIRNINN